MLEKFLKNTLFLYNNSSQTISKFNELKSSQVDLTREYICSIISQEEKIDLLDDLCKELKNPNIFHGVYKKLINLKNKVLNYNNLSAIGFLGSVEKIEELKKHMCHFIENLDRNIFSDSCNNKNINNITKESILIIDKAQHNCQICKIFNIKGYGEKPEISILCKLISNKLICSDIKENGEVYGIYVSPHISSDKISIFTYQSSNPDKMIHMLNHIPDFLTNSCFNQQEINIAKKSLLSSFETNKVDLVMKEIEMLICEKRNYCEWLNNYIESVRSTNENQLNKFANNFNKIIKSENLYVVSSKTDNKIQKLFDKIICFDKKS